MSGAERDGEAPISTWEWGVGAVGLLLVLATVAFLLREARHPYTPPDVVVRADSVTRAGAGWLVHVRAANRGRATAQGVTIEGELAGPGADTTMSEATLDYVPGGSERFAGLYFPRDPRAGRLALRALGYQAP